ncbi:integrase core domain-containing protein [Micrococcus luteus]
MDPVLVAAVAQAAAGHNINIAAVCRETGTSRATFYRKLARFKAEGSAGLVPRSRAPHTRPTSTPEHVCDAVVRARKELADEGWDNGPISIRWRLLDTATTDTDPDDTDPDDTEAVPAEAVPAEAVPAEEVPSRATIARILSARGQVTAQPQKRPRRTTRFERSTPNALWQIDGSDIRLADGTTACVIQIIDDHSRLDIASRAAPSENTDDLWAALQTGFTRYGMPACVLSDNGTALSGRHRRGVGLVELERRLAREGITTIASRFKHPQTCGKNERVHQTLQRWLAARPAPHGLPELQALLDDYHDRYNRRRHQSLGGQTPEQRFRATEPAHPLGPALRVAGVATRTVSAAGVISFGGASIGVGRREAGTLPSCSGRATASRS